MYRVEICYLGDEGVHFRAGTGFHLRARRGDSEVQYRRHSTVCQGYA